MLSFIQFFQDFLQKNITVTIVIMSVLFVRILMRKFPKKYSYILWSFVGIRMIFDISVSSRMSLFTLLGMVVNQLRWIFAEGVVGTAMEVDSQMPENPGNMLNVEGTFKINEVTAGADQITPIITDTYPVVGEVNVELTSESFMSVVLTVLAIIWMIGVIALLGYGIISYVKCKKSVCQAVRVRGNIWECDRISSPFILGMISPQIYIPFHLEADERKYILAHENCHIRRLDYVTKLLAFCLLAVYWINPFAWVSFHLMSRDMEMSCDEAVLEKFGEGIKKAYSASLLHAAKERKFYSFAPIAFGEAEVGKRIKNVLRFKKPKVWLTILLLFIIVLVGVASLTNAKTNPDEQVLENTAEMPEEIIPQDNTPTDNMSTDNAPADNSSVDMVVLESGEISTELYEIYMAAIERLAKENIFPDGQAASPDETLKAENMYQIGDVDGDGRAELIINYPNAAAMAGMVYYIFDYDEERGEFYQELAEFPAVTIYDNGIILAEASHNHGRSSMDDFWPYSVYEYNADKDAYEQLAWVDAWEEVMFDGATPDADFPHEADIDGDGVLYYWADLNTFEPTNIMDNAAYEEWMTNLTVNANLINVEYEKLPIEADEIYKIWESDALDMNGNGVSDHASVIIQKEGGEYRNIVNVLLDDGSGWEMEYPGRTDSREDFITVQSGRLHFADRDSLVLEITNSTSNYGSTDIHVLSMIEEEGTMKLVEAVTVLDGMTASPWYEQYKDTVFMLNATVTITAEADLIKYVDVLETNAVQINDYGSDYCSYLYWTGTNWNVIWYLRNMSPEAQMINDTATAFFEAYTNKDISQMQSYLYPSYGGDLEVYEADAGTVERILVKGLPASGQEVAVGEKYHVQVEFLNIAESDTLQYLDIILFKEEEYIFKVLSYGRDA